MHGLLQVLDAGQMNRLHAGALAVLERTGLQIQGDFLLRALADAGCKVDFQSHRAWFPPELVERQLEAQRGRYKMVRSSLWYPFCREMPASDVAAADRFTVDYGFATPWIFDYPQRRYRKPTVDDQVDAIRLGNALECVAAVNAPYICGDYDPRTENIESARLLMLHTKKPGWVGTSSGAQVKYLAEMAALAAGDSTERLRTQPPIIVTAYCTTSPLKLDTRSCEVLGEALKHGFPVNFAPMPILGATTPMTPAGSVVVAAAEILGCLTATTLVNPYVFYYSTSISAEMDMRTTQVCFATPAAMLTDAALHQLFRFKYGMVHNIEPAYVEAKVPGIQAAAMKVFRQMALGSTASLPLAIGTLDSAAVFSPTGAWRSATRRCAWTSSPRWSSAPGGATWKPSTPPGISARWAGSRGCSTAATATTTARRSSTTRPCWRKPIGPGGSLCPGRSRSKWNRRWRESWIGSPRRRERNSWRRNEKPTAEDAKDAEEDRLG
jgi:trimethylamine--corrinoid protein Co-methyltransferase